MGTLQEFKYLFEIPKFVCYVLGDLLLVKSSLTLLYFKALLTEAVV